eukprot:912892_1
MCMKTVATSTEGDDIAQAYDQHRIQKELRDFYKFTSYIRHGDYNSLYFLQQEKTHRLHDPIDPIDALSQISVSPEIDNEIDIDIDLDIGTKGSTKAIAMAYEKDSEKSISSFPTASSTITPSRNTSKQDAITPLYSAFLARTGRTSAPHAFHIPNMVDDSYTESIHTEGFNPNPVLEDEAMSTSDFTSKTTASIADLKAKKRQIERHFETGKCAPKNSIVYDGYEFDIPIRLHPPLTARYI